MALTETRTHAPSSPQAERSSVLPRVLSATLTAGGKAMDRLGKMGSAVRTRFSKTTPDLTEEALSFLPRQERAEVWARFGDLNTQDAEAVAPVRETANNAKINKGFIKWFAETALVNSRQRQGSTYRHSLELQPDGRERVQQYLKRRSPTVDEEMHEGDVFLDRAVGVIDERVETGELTAGEARAVMEGFAEDYKDAKVKNHLSIFAERKAAEAVRAKEKAAKGETKDSPKVAKLDDHRHVEEVDPAVVVFAGVIEEIALSR